MTNGPSYATALGPPRSPAPPCDSVLGGCGCRPHSSNGRPLSSESSYATEDGSPSGRSLPELPRGPRQRDFELPELKLTHSRRALRRRQPGTRRKEPGHSGGERTCIRQDLPRLGAVLEPQAG